jgi:toxin-antitoxin system PIN domain toxin
MTSVDTNILVYAANQDSPFRQNAQSFLDSHRDNRDFVLCELVLFELYMCLRNPAIFRSPLSAPQAVTYCDALRSNPSWQMVDVAPEIRPDLWRLARSKDFPFRRMIDARLGLSLVFHRVTEFATANVKHFHGLGFRRVWNPLQT